MHQPTTGTTQTQSAPGAFTTKPQHQPLTHKMADERDSSSPKDSVNQENASEDAETRATRRELKQSSISDSVGDGVDQTEKRLETPPKDQSPKDQSPKDQSPKDQRSESKESNKEDQNQAPSPKKKRGHDQLDPSKEEEQADDSSVASADSSKDRALRSEPEKKRHRDAEGSAEVSSETKTEQDEVVTETKDEKSKSSTDTNAKDTRQTSASAFAASSFGKLSSETSPFAGLGSSSSNGFGSPAKAPLTSFASSTKKSEQQPLAAAPKLSFGSTTSASPFATVPSGTNGFASGHSGNSIFGTTNGAKPLSSFASGTAKPLQTMKSAKPFGAPDDDVEEEEDNAENSDEDGNSTADKDQGASADNEDDKSKVKLSKVEVDDGEADEATLLSVRAKMFVHEGDIWKERGAGMLKINVPISCVEFDENNAVVPGSFDASALQDDGDEPSHKVVRLLMRQDQTHRVILNTAVIPAIKFTEKTSLKSTSVLFTAFEGDNAKPLLVTMRMTAANAKLFKSEVESVQRELQTR